jgi:hypothetical protein
VSMSATIALATSSSRLKSIKSTLSCSPDLWLVALELWPNQ